MVIKSGCTKDQIIVFSLILGWCSPYKRGAAGNKCASRAQQQFFSLVDSHKVYNYWFQHWNLNLEEYEDFYLTQLGIKNGSVIQIDDVNKEVFSEDFLKKKFVTKEPSTSSFSGWEKLRSKTSATMGGIL